MLQNCYIYLRESTNKGSPSEITLLEMQSRADSAERGLQQHSGSTYLGKISDRRMDLEDTCTNTFRFNTGF